MRARTVRVAALTSGSSALTLPLYARSGYAAARASTGAPTRTSPACASGTSAVTHTVPMPASLNSVVPGMTAMPSRAPISQTMPDCGAVSVTRADGLPSRSKRAISASGTPSRRNRCRAASASAARARLRARLQRQQFFLCGEPLGHVQIDERRARRDAVVLRAHVELFDVAGAARLHGDDRALIDADRADGREPRVERSLADLRRADAEVLDEARADRHLAFVGRCVRIDRDQIHVHEGTLARLVEFLIGDHRIVPVKNLGLRRLGRGRHGGAAAIGPDWTPAALGTWRAPNQYPAPAAMATPAMTATRGTSFAPDWVWRRAFMRPP